MRRCSRMASDLHPDVAILDAALKDGPCQEVALALGKRAVPFLIYSGFSADRELIADFASVTSGLRSPPTCGARAGLPSASGQRGLNSSGNASLG